MKKIFSYLYCAFLTVNGFSQSADSKVEWSEWSKTSDLNFETLLGINDGSFYTEGGFQQQAYFTRPGKFRIKKYDLNTFSNSYDVLIDKFEYKDKYVTHIKSSIENDIVVLYFEVFLKKQNRKYLIKRSISESGELLEPEEIMEVMTPTENTSTFYIELSPNSSKRLILSGPSPYGSNKRKGKLDILILGDNNQKIYERKVSFPRFKYDIKLIKYSITNNGDLFVVGQASETGAEGKAFNKVFYLNQATNRFEELELNLSGNFISNLVLKSDFENNTMLLTGLYGSEPGTVAGSFYITVDQNTQGVNQSFLEEFPAGFMANFMSESKAEKGSELTSFSDLNLFDRNNGGFILVAERRKSWYQNSSSGMSSTTHLAYGILVVNYDINGKVKWNGFVPKKQKAKNQDWLLGYTVIDQGRNFSLIFNDHEDNLERIAEGKKLKWSETDRNSKVTVASFDEQGKMTRDYFFNVEEMTIVPDLSKKIDDSQLFLYSQKDREGRFGRLQLNE